MTEKQFTKKFIIEYFNCSEYFFESTWQYVNAYYGKTSNLQTYRDGVSILYDKCRTNKQKAVLKAMLIFTTGFREVSLKGNIAENILASVQEACNHYAAERKLSEEILKTVKTSKDEIASFFKHKEAIKKLKPEEEKAEYRVWYKDSGPKGKPIDVKEKEGIIANSKNYGLVIVREETRTQVFIKGKEIGRPPGKLAYRILSYVLKHKGSGGTAWNIAQHVWESTCTASFKDVRESIKAIEMQQRIEKAKIEDSMTEIERISTLVRRRVTDLNKYFLKKLNIKLQAKEMGEYELTTVPKYCLIEKA